MNVDESVKMSLKLEKLKLPEMITGRSEQVQNVAKDFLKSLESKCSDKWPPCAIWVAPKSNECPGFSTKSADAC